jgi:hypothetical protein
VKTIAGQLPRWNELVAFALIAAAAVIAGVHV